jgi:hypothetical protein
MFRRRRKEVEGGEACPFCDHLVPDGVSTCPQCYYALDRSPRHQDERPDDQTQLELLTLLESEHDTVEEVAPLVEAVLSMADITVEVPEYAPSAPMGDDDLSGEVEFMPTAGPTLNDTQAWSLPEEVELQASDVRPNAGTFIVPEHDPMDDVGEPVPLGLGGLHSPSAPHQRDEDLTAAMDPLPELPDLDAIDLSDVAEEAQVTLASAVVEDNVVDEPQPAPAVDVAPSVTTEHGRNDDLPDDDMPDLPDLDEVADNEGPATAPPVQHPARWMPWPLTTQPWNLAVAQQALVPAFESLQAGRIERAGQELDHVGQHLPDDLDLLYHVGMLLKQLGRGEAFKALFLGAAAAHPGDPRIAQAAAALR